jgi:hypothetical protein
MASLRWPENCEYFMSAIHFDLRTALLLAAILQFAIAILNLGLNRIMGWKEDLDRMPLLIREVHQVHAWFISVTLAIFATITWRFAGDFASGTNPICRWLAMGIGLFWALRVVLQVAYYSSSHWRGKAGRTAIHISLLLIYGEFAAAYLMAAMRGG